MATVDLVLFIAALAGVVLVWIRLRALGSALMVGGASGVLVHYYMGATLAAIVNEHPEEFDGRSWNFVEEASWTLYVAWPWLVVGLLVALVQGFAPKD